MASLEVRQPTDPGYKPPNPGRPALRRNRGRRASPPRLPLESFSARRRRGYDYDSGSSEEGATDSDDGDSGFGTGDSLPANLLSFQVLVEWQDENGRMLQRDAIVCSGGAWVPEV